LPELNDIMKPDVLPELNDILKTYVLPDLIRHLSLRRNY